MRGCTWGMHGMRDMIASVAGLLVVASPLAGCALQGDSELHAGTYDVTGVEIGTCADDTWTTSGTTVKTVALEPGGDAWHLTVCSPNPGLPEPSCMPGSPSVYRRVDDRWWGEAAAFYEGGRSCLLVYVEGTLERDGDRLTIESSDWRSDVTSASCTYEAALAMKARPCDMRFRLHALEQ